MTNLVRCCFDATGTLAVIFVLDTPSQLRDPAFNPSHLTYVDIHRDDYAQCSSVADVVTQALPILEIAAPQLAATVSVNLAAVQAAANPVVTATAPAVVTTAVQAEPPVGGVTNTGSLSP